MIGMYCINLKRNPERYSTFLQDMAKGGFHDIIRVNAVDGNELTSQELGLLSEKAKNNIDKLRTNHIEIFTRGAIGCYLSHFYLWKMMIANGIEDAIIFEDDAKPLRNTASSELADIVQDIRKLGYNKMPACVMLDYINIGTLKDDGNYYNLKQFFLMTAYYITNNCARKLIQKAIPLELQVDHYMSSMAVSGDITVLGVKNKMFRQNEQYKSDIQTWCIGCPDLFSGVRTDIIIIVMVIIFIVITIIFVRCVVI